MSDKKNPFYYDQDFTKIDFRKNPEKYRIGRGEQGVLSVQPYKSEILPHWRFRNPKIARESSEKIFEMFEQYKKEKDFVGMDMARKFLQMGWTRSRRYANHPSGKKYSDEDKENAPKIKKSEIPDYKDPRNRKHYVVTKTKKIRPLKEDPIKAESARIFYKKYFEAREDPIYKKMKEEHKKKYDN